MKGIIHIFKFVFLDNLRSAWAIAYMLFFAVSTYALIYFTGSFTRSMVSIMNIVILIAPLVSTMMTAMYYFNKTDLLYLLLAQPVKRAHIFIGMYLGIALTLCLSVGLGLGLGMLVGMSYIENLNLLLTLIFSGMMLSLIFSAISLLISVASKDKLKGVGLSLLTWLFMAVIYDGLLLIYFVAFADYPIEQHAIVLSVLNPIDLSRIFIMLQLDISALMGYSGAVFQQFFGTTAGMIICISVSLLWVIFPVALLLYKARRKDY
ncbi:MAG: ABC transporter permease subunit [Salibacteraceae bacterium]